MLTVTGRIDLLDRSHELSAERDFIGLIALLAAVPQKTLLAEPELGHYLALAFSQTDQQGEADRLLINLEESCANRGNDRLFRRRRNLQAVSCIRQGKLARAEVLFRDVQLASDIDGDSKFLATATMNLGVVFDMRCEWDNALTHYRYALVLFQKLGDRASMAGCYHNLGMLHRQRGDLEEAEAFLERAMENYHPTGTLQERIATDLERALTVLEQGDFERAGAIAQFGLSRGRLIANQRLVAESLRSLGIIRAQERAYPEARELLSEALSIPSIGGNLMLEGELNEELSFIEHEVGNYELSMSYLEVACRLYQRLGSAARARRATLRLNATQPVLRNI